MAFVDYKYDAYSNSKQQVWGLDFASIDSFVYQIDRDNWWKFLGIDILDIPVILSGGSLDENYNLWLDSERSLQKYPGTVNTGVDSYIETKEWNILKGLFQRYLIDYDGGSADVITNVRRVVSDVETIVTDEKSSVIANEMRYVALDKSRGRSMSITIYNAEIIKSILFDIKEWGER